MFGSLFSRHSGETVLVLDMGSASIGAGVVVLTPDDKPRVAYMTRIPLAVQDKLEPSSFLKIMSSYLTQALERVQKHAPAHLKPLDAPTSISSVYATFSAPWYASAIHTAHESFEQPQSIDSSFIESLIEHARETFVENEENYFAGERFTAAPRLIETEVTDIRINGYQTPDPIGKAASDLDVTVFFSAIPQTVAERVEQSIGQFFDISDLTYHTQPHVLYRGIDQYTAMFQNLLLIEVSGDRTEIGAIRDSSLQHVYSFSFGSNDLVRRVATALETGNELAASFIQMYRHGQADDELAEQLRETIDTVLSEWVEQCEAIFCSVRDDQYWSRHAVIVGNIDMSDLFTAAINADAPPDSERGTLSITGIDTERIQDVVAFRDEDDCDPFIAFEALFAAKVRRSE